MMNRPETQLIGDRSSAARRSKRRRGLRACALSLA
jgi:hypothetical protein